jgi:Tfp pilus assembly protein PilN
MRPVNLIPPEQRRGENAPMRTGPVPYILLGALALVLAGVAVLVLTNNQIADRKSEVVQLKREDAAARAQAESLVAYTQFQKLHEARVTTVTSLADSRFDWERVMRELSLVLPHDVWLISLEASASPESSASGSGGSSGSGLSSSIKGPSLTISGCATGQDAVAGFVTTLKDIDGVTRVGLESSELSEQESGAGAAGASSSGSGGGGDCRTRSFIAKFEIVVAFDAAPVPATGSTTTSEVLPSATEDAQTASSETSEGSAGG